MWEEYWDLNMIFWNKDNYFVFGKICIIRDIERVGEKLEN